MITDINSDVNYEDEFREIRDQHLEDFPFDSYAGIVGLLRERNQRFGSPLTQAQISEIAGEATYKQGLVPTDNTIEFLEQKARSFKDKTPDELVRLLRKFNDEHCITRVSDEVIESIAADAGRDEPKEELGVLMSDVEAEKVEWLWAGRIPLGKITILDGDPGLGKSLITMDLAARITTGRSFPNGDVDHLDHLDHLGGVVILSAEDGLADTIKPRLQAAGADCTKVLAISTVPDGQGSERTLSIPEHIDTLEQAIDRVDAKLVIIDPLMAFLSGKANYDQDVRKALTPLARMADRRGVAILVVRHLNKQQGTKALYRGGSSIGIIGAARTALVVEQHPDNEDQRVLAVNKTNLAKEASSLTYTVVEDNDEIAMVEWVGTTSLKASDILNPDTSKLDEAKTWLRKTLSGGPMRAAVVKAKAKDEGISEKTLYRAKDALGIKPYKVEHWYWSIQDGQGGQDSQDGLADWLA